MEGEKYREERERREGMKRVSAETSSVSKGGGGQLVTTSRYSVRFAGKKKQFYTKGWAAEVSNVSLNNTLAILQNIHALTHPIQRANRHIQIQNNVVPMRTTVLLEYWTTLLTTPTKQRYPTCVDILF